MFNSDIWEANNDDDGSHNVFPSCLLRRCIAQKTLIVLSHHHDTGFYLIPLIIYKLKLPERAKSHKEYVIIQTSHSYSFF